MGHSKANFIAVQRLSFTLGAAPASVITLKQERKGLQTI